MMSPLTIVLLVAGAVLLAASFFIPDREERENKMDIEFERAEIRRLIEGELDSMKLRVNEATNEAVDYGMDKYERSLDKLANEKMMAVGEYATAVMEEIDKNHKEVLFLYDMLNNKQTDVKNTVRNAEAAVREISNATKTANETVKSVVNSASVAKANMEASMEEMNEKQSLWREQQMSVRPTQQSQVKSVFTKFDSSAANDDDSAFTPINVFRSSEPPVSKKQEMEDEFVELQKTTFKNVSNNNQQIIMLNKEGKSVIEIARQLKLGVGEVQLVLDLFK